MFRARGCCSWVRRSGRCAVKVCGIPLDHFQAEKGLRNRWRASGYRLNVNITAEPSIEFPDRWRCEFQGFEIHVGIYANGTVEQARDALEAAVLKDFGHKLAFLRWVLEQKETPP